MQIIYKEKKFLLERPCSGSFLKKTMSLSRLSKTSQRKSNNNGVCSDGGFISHDNIFFLNPLTFLK